MPGQNLTPAERDRSLSFLSRLTKFAVAGTAAAMLLVSVVLGRSIPGKAATASPSPKSSSSSPRSSAASPSPTVATPTPSASATPTATPNATPVPTPTPTPRPVAPPTPAPTVRSGGS